MVWFIPAFAETLPMQMALKILSGRRSLRSALFLKLFLWMTCKRIARNTQRQMAILLDEYGGMAGLAGRPAGGDCQIDDETNRAEIEVIKSVRLPILHRSHSLRL